MSESNFELLASHLETLPGGFARTSSGSELRILRQLFTAEEAWVAAHLKMLPEPLEVVAYRSHLPLQQSKDILDSLLEKRLISGVRIGGKQEYMAQQFVVGFWEGQVNRLNRDLVEAFEEYLPAYAETGLWGKAPQLRVIPIQKTISMKNNIMAYEQLSAIMDKHTVYGVANCICRQEMRILDKDCGKPLETCLVFDGAVEYFIQSGRGRRITRAEADELIRVAEQKGLVLQPGNTKNPGNICMCCGCCCGVLRSLKMRLHPAEEVSSDFVAHLDVEKCNGCKVCLKRCQMDALVVKDGKAQLDLNRCIGCGLCASTCKQAALKMVRKNRSMLPKLPENDIFLSIRMAQAHGQLGWLQILGLLILSGIDRVRANSTYRKQNPSF